MDSFIILCYLYVALPSIPTEMTLRVISGTYQTALLISRICSTNISCTAYISESWNCVVVCLVLQLISDKVFLDPILKFILITIIYAHFFLHNRTPAVIFCKRHENTRVIMSKNSTRCCKKHIMDQRCQINIGSINFA